MSRTGGTKMNPKPQLSYGNQKYTIITTPGQLLRPSSQGFQGPSSQQTGFCSQGAGPSTQGGAFVRPIRPSTRPAQGAALVQPSGPSAVRQQEGTPMFSLQGRSTQLGASRPSPSPTAIAPESSSHKETLERLYTGDFEPTENEDEDEMTDEPGADLLNLLTENNIKVIDDRLTGSAEITGQGQGGQGDMMEIGNHDDNAVAQKSTKNFEVAIKKSLEMILREITNLKSDVKEYMENSNDKVDQVLQKLNTLQINSGTEKEMVDPELEITTADYPVKDQPTFDSLEKKLANKIVKANFEKKLALAGGKTVEEASRRVLNTVMTEDCMMLFTLKGYKAEQGKGNFSITKIYECVKAAVYIILGEGAKVDDRQIELAVGEYLTGAKSRKNKRIEQEEKRKKRALEIEQRLQGQS